MKEALETTASAVLENGRPGSGRVSTPFAPGVDFIFNSTLPLDISAPVVFAGYGISEKSVAYDDLAGIDVRDKIVLILSDAPGKDDHASPFQKKEIKEKYFPAMPSRRGGVDYSKAAAHLQARRPGRAGCQESLSDDGDIQCEILAQQQVRDDKPILPDSRKKLLIPGSKAMPWEGRSIVRVSREMADAILAAAGETVESLQKKITVRYRPHSFTLPGPACASATRCATGCSRAPTSSPSSRAATRSSRSRPSSSAATSTTWDAAAITSITAPRTTPRAPAASWPSPAPWRSTRRNPSAASSSVCGPARRRGCWGRASTWSIPCSP